ncbi:MAG TPA: DUF305 domain-containing protein [Gemmatimonadaceae bacterium]|nr:DUF305 domain-containing protein [Gemmatimonadaceae bacterium]
MTTAMTASLARRFAATLVAAAATAACGGATGSGAAAPPQPASAEQGQAAAIARARADSARYPYTAADVHFMSAMIHHHAQAIAMSRLAPTHGADAAVIRLADRIINAQQDEIATMQKWLGDRGQRVPEATPGPMKMTMGGMEHEMLMPGMLTADEMKQLDEARGKEFDRRFLASMIRHHRGAVSMVQELFGTYGAAQDEIVFKFANDVNVDQTTEIARMERMLAALTLGISAP